MTISLRASNALSIQKLHNHAFIETRGFARHGESIYFHWECTVECSAQMLFRMAGLRLW
jgi:hypothetical protein